MGACSGAGGAIIFHRFFQECALLVCQRMHISHHRNLILGCPIKNEGMNSVGYGQILYQKTFSRALSRAYAVFAAVTCGVLFFFTRRPLRWPDWVQEDAAFLTIL